MSRKVNLKLLAFLLGAVGLFAVGVHFLHGIQERRNAGALLEQATRAEEDGQQEQAVKHLRNYLGFVPDDTDALARYGLLLDRLARTPNSRAQALLVLEQALRRDPRRHEVRRQLVQLAMHPQLARFGDAREHLEVLLRDTAPADGELEQMMGRCHAMGSDFALAAQWYEKAIQHAPQRLEAYLALADVYRRRLDKPKQADRVLDRLVEQNPESFRAYLTRGRYRCEYGSIDQAAADIDRAAELAPDDADVILSAASLALQRGTLDTARNRLAHGLKLHPKNTALYQLLAELEFQARRPEEAVACLRQGIDAVPQQTDLLWALASLLIQQGQEAADEIGRLAQRGVPASQRDFLKARILMNQKQWLTASRLLEKIQPDLRSHPELAKQVDLFLGQCHGHLGNVDQQCAAYRRAVNADPLWEPACLGLASAQAALGHIEDALNIYRRLLTRVPSVRLPMARLLIVQNLRLPAERRRWQEVDKLLNEAAEAMPEQNEIPILRAEVLAAQNKFAEAQQLVTKVRDGQPQQLDTWIALAALAERQGKPENVLPLLDEAVQQLGDRVELRLTRAWFLSKRGGAEVRERLTALQENCERFSPEDQRRLLTGLAEGHARCGDLAGAVKLRTRLAEQAPNDLGARMALFDLALQTDDDALRERVLKEMAAIEGSDGTLWRYGQAHSLLQQARKGNTTALEQARAILTQLGAARPTWSRVPLALAEVSDLQKDPSGAIKHYQRAMELGERGPRALRRLVELLYQQRRYGEADEVVRNLSEQEGIATGVQRLAAELSLRRHDPDRALQQARQAVSAQSKDYRDHLWLGQFLSASPQPEQAEPVLRRAVEMAETVPDTWIALIFHLVRAGQKDKAEVALREAQRKLPGAQGALSLAPCLEALGRSEQARRTYAEALAARPDDATLLRTMASFCLRHGPGADADQHLRRLMKLRERAAEDAAWARRTLAVLLASSGDYAQWREALALLDLREDAGPPATTAENLEDQRARAVVLAAQKTRRQRQKAIALLEDLRNRQPLGAEEQFLLAQLHETAGAWPQARQQMLQLLAVHGDSARYVAHYAHALIQRGEAAEAELWLAKLDKLPEAPGTFALAQVRARLLAARGRSGEVIALLDTFADRKDARPTDPVVRQSLVAAMFDELTQSYPTEKGYAAAAEQRYRALSARQPGLVLTLATLLARQGRTADALDLCAGAWESCPAEAVAGVCLAVVRSAPTSPEHQQRVERWLTAAVQKAPQSVGVLVCLADLRDLQGRYAEAEKLYRKVIELDPRHVVALNNTAYLLALQENRIEESQALLNRALAVAGPMPELLDTRALIHIKTGRAQQAIRDLEEALTESPLPLLSYHLAQAHKVANNPGAARDALRKAKGLGLQADQLHALERATFQQLHAELETR